MKKATSIALCLFAAVLVSCSGGSSGDSAPSGVQTNISASGLVGKWIFSGSEDDGNVSFSMLMNFEANANMDVYMLSGATTNEYYAKCSTTFSVSGNKLTINASDCGGGGPKIEQTESDFVVNNNEFTFTDSNGGNITFTKWTGELSSLTQIKSQSTPDMGDSTNRMAPQISINAYPVPSSFLFFKTR
ncbi:MAG: hypothetical protein COV46_02170 [Deltaproteobacteria bacterium CG11_big_fil_rev_8_21_14_0_20_49_13]|nr:MAG: hypothetical protein COV46_02170 [Deltaproteobacteria bacterium CG11_big_fil_rev_8_21_14_0_20_49_13]